MPKMVSKNYEIVRTTPPTPLGEFLKDFTKYCPEAIEPK